MYNEAVVNSGRKDMLLVAIFQEILPADLPSVVSDAFKEDGRDGQEIMKSFKVTTPSGGWFYCLEVTEDGRKKRIYLDELGRYHDSPY